MDSLGGVSIVAAIVALLVFAGLLLYLTFFSGKKEGLLVVGSQGDLADGTNDGLEPGRFWGVRAAPWQNVSPKVDNDANIEIDRLQSTTGWDWGPYQIPYKTAWFNPSYNWYFDPKYWQGNVPINVYRGGDQMCMNNYKLCVDSLGPNPDRRCVAPFEQCIASIPKIGTESIGH